MAEADDSDRSDGPCHLCNDLEAELAREYCGESAEERRVVRRPLSVPLGRSWMTFWSAVMQRSSVAPTHLITVVRRGQNVIQLRPSGTGQWTSNDPTLLASRHSLPASSASRSVTKMHGPSLDRIVGFANTAASPQSPTGTTTR